MDSFTRRYLYLLGVVLAVALVIWLAELQFRASSLVEAHPEVDRVRWQLDERWLAEHGVMLQP